MKPYSPVFSMSIGSCHPASPQTMATSSRATCFTQKCHSFQCMLSVPVKWGKMDWLSFVVAAVVFRISVLFIRLFSALVPAADV